MGRYAVGLLALVLSACGESVATAPDLDGGVRVVTVLTQGVHNEAIEMLVDLGVACELVSREDTTPGRFSREPNVFREAWECRP